MTLTPERWLQVREVLHEAMQMDEQERSAFLDSQCATDPSLRAELNELLAAEREIGSSFLEFPALAHASVHTDNSATGTVLAAGTRLGPYVVQTLIGAGGMGEVYRARDASLKRDVAIKVLPTSFSRDPDRLRRFQLEAEAAAALNHPNILSIFHIGQQDGSPYIVTELLEGETLRERLRRGAMRLRDAIAVAIAAANGLAAAHEKGIAHRDLKPENLFLAKDGRVKILDFGLAKLMQKSSDTDGSTISLQDRTDAGRVLGTVGYMSPEQVRSEPADARSDIFSLGCVLYEMLTGKRSFCKPTAVETMRAILNEDPPAASEITRTIPPALQRVVHRCLEKSADRRFQSASDLAFALDALSDSATASLSAGREQKSNRANRARIAVVTVATLAALLSAVFIYLWFRPEPTPRVSNYVQLTHDGRPKVLVGTDGARLYLGGGFYGTAGISVIPIVGGEATKIATPSRQMYAIDVSTDGSQLLVVDGGNNAGPATLWSLPTLAGSPRRLGDTIGQSAAWSIDGKLLAYSNDRNLFVAKADGSDSRKIASLKDPVYFPAWSPDGTQLRFDVWQVDVTRASLWEVSTDGANLHRVLPGWRNPPDECCGKWTADGRYFAFLSNDQVWALPRKAGFLHSRPKPIQLTSSPMSLRSPLPSKDGKKLYVVGRTYRGELVRYDLRSGQFVPLLGGISAEYVDFSRDGQRVVYVSYPEGTLWCSRADGGERQQLSYPPIYAMLPRWSPDGKNIVFFDLNSEKPARMYEISPQGGSLRQLMPDDPFHQMDPTWSPDGEKIAFGGNANDPASTIRILDLASRQVSTLPGSQGLYGPRWSPNGRFIIAQTMDGGTIMLFDFGNEKWSELAKLKNSGWQNWSKDGSSIYVLGAGTVLRIRVADRKIETVVELKDFATAGRYGSGLTLAPDDSPIILRDNGTQDVFALDWEEQ